MFSMGELAANIAKSKGSLQKQVVITKKEKTDVPQSELEKKLSMRNLKNTQ
jgi:hypothetical protein